MSATPHRVTPDGAVDCMSESALSQRGCRAADASRRNGESRTIHPTKG